jgi:hypothetical protein
VTPVSQNEAANCFNTLNPNRNRLEKLVLVREQTHDRLSFGNPLNRFSDQGCHGELANFLAGLGF